MLCTLLREDPRARRMWMPYAPASGRGIHQGAVAQVLAEFQWSTGQQPRSNSDLPRRLKDTVSRALSGKSLSRRSLRMFIDAFAFDEQSSEALWACWTGVDQRREDAIQRNRPNATSSRTALTA